MNLKQIFKNIGGILDGKKTYIFILALVLFALADMKNLVPLDLVAYKSEIYLGLLAGAGISLRAGVSKAIGK